MGWGQGCVFGVRVRLRVRVRFRVGNYGYCEV